MMNEQQSRDFVYFKIPVFYVDLCIHLGVLFILLHYFPLLYIQESRELWPSLTPFVLLTLAFCISISIIGMKFQKRGIKYNMVIRVVLSQSFLTYVLFIAFTAMTYKFVPNQLLLFQVVMATVAVTLFHCFVVKLIRKLRKLGHNTRSVVIVGSDSDVKQLCKELNEGEGVQGYRILGIFCNSLNIPLGVKYMGTVDDFFRWSMDNSAEEIYCALNPYVHGAQIAQIVRICNDHLTSLNFVPSMNEYPHREMTMSKLGTVMLLHFRQEPMNSLLSKFWKRSFDIAASSVFLCTLYPLIVGFVWIGNKMFDNDGPLYFRQARTGYNGKTFKIYKFRSMKVNPDADKLQATKDDPRKTAFGDFLRRSSIDEFPQFINIFLGDMSLIGPRPHMVYHTEMYSSMIGDYMIRHLVKPGVTGWAQVNGCRGETKTVNDMVNRVKHDVWYIENWSLFLDVKIIFMTISQVFLHKDKQAY